MARCTQTPNLLCSLVWCDSQFCKLLQKSHRLRIADWLHVRSANTALLQNFYWSYPATSAGLTLCDLAGKVNVFDFWQQVSKISLISFTELPKIVPSTSNICADMKDNYTLASWMAGAILLDHSHDASDKLNERAQVGKYASDHCNRQILVVEAFPQHSCLNNDVEIVIFQLLENTIIGLPLAGMDIGRTKTPSAECFRDLDTVIVIDCGSDNFEALLASTLSQPA